MKSLKTSNRAAAAYKVHPDFLLTFLPKPELTIFYYSTKKGVIHKVHTPGGGKGGPAKSALAHMGRVTVKL